MFVILYSCISENNHSRLQKKFLTKFPLDYQKRVLLYKKWQDVQRRILGRLLLIKGLEINGENFDDHIIEYTSNGKPYFKDSNIKFNTSYSGNKVVCIISNISLIGIDIEKNINININDYTNQFSEKEFNLIKTAKNKEEFFKFWTKKEAVVKANGMGLSIPLNSFEVIDNDVSLNKTFFHLNEVKIAKNYICHIAMEKRNTLLNLNPIRIIY